MTKESDDLSEDNSHSADLTIDERIAKGKQTGHHYDGAIVPFPPGIREEAILWALKGGERASVDELLRTGYRVKYHEYRSAAGELILTVLRFEHPTGIKTFKPVRYCGQFPGKGSVFWIKALDRPWPLYGLDQLAARPVAPVLVVEGEKTADAGRINFPDHVVITWPSGASNSASVELLALAGRRIILWPDNDEAGRKAMLRFAAAAYEAGASAVSLVDVPSELGDKWDLADSLPVEAESIDLNVLVETATPINPEAVAHLSASALARAEQRRLLGQKPGFSRVEVADVETALSLLDASMHGDDWRRVARCIFYAFGDRGLPLFDTWSQSSPEKYRSGEAEKLWQQYRVRKVFRSDPLAWLFRKAQRALQLRMEGDEADRPNITLDLQALKVAAIEELNENHAVVVRGGKTGVLWETYDPRFGRYTEVYLSKRDFIDRYVPALSFLPTMSNRTPRRTSVFSTARCGSQVHGGDHMMACISRRVKGWRLDS